MSEEDSKTGLILMAADAETSGAEAAFRRKGLLEPVNAGPLESAILERRARGDARERVGVYRH